MTWDLLSQGPHLLVAGTTGSGKSELLQSLILALASQHSPAALAMALIDFKGGASFGPCPRLPHVLGQVTDLDLGGASRCLDGLHAEVRRRKQVLLTHGVPHLSGLPAGTLPRLLVVIDEFRTLSEELDKRLGSLLRIAAQGRSLGIHLVLATQRPAGAVSAEMRANVTARLCLRVVGVGDSHDVIDSPLAASLSPGRPGRAVLRVGSAPPRLLQCAYADAPERAEKVEVRRAPTWAEMGEPPQAPPPVAGPAPVDSFAGNPASLGGLQESSMEGSGKGSVADSVKDSGKDTAGSPVRSPAVRLVERARQAHSPTLWAPLWLPALPPVIPVTDLPRPTDEALPFALADLPAAQTRQAVTWRPDEGPLAVIGRARSGRTTALVTLAAQALSAQTPSSQALSLRALSLRALSAQKQGGQEPGAQALGSPGLGAPALGAQVPGAQVPNTEGLAPPGRGGGWRVQVLADRRSLPQFERLGPAVTLASSADPVAAASLLTTLGACPLPGPTLLLIDGLEALREVLFLPGADPLAGALGAVGLAVAVTAEGAGLAGMAARFGPRLLLATGDPAADQMLGVPPRLAGLPPTPGRGVWMGAGGPAECQVAAPPGAP
ncbi:MAG: FtsK/SpoIIIE domain-containing protein [Promicromonosporaceae bacterium]|nr:FtsK/SpoIIIE domain-containing protein [Promicromonosporaceae bacterium]